MFGFIGIKDNVVFKLLLLSLLSGCTQEAYATTFQSNVKAVLRETSKEQKILVFINPQCPWCEKSLENLTAFKKRTSRWLVNVYVMASVKEFIDFCYQHVEALTDGLEYNLDLNNSLADKYEINITPSYIIMNQGQIKKVEGYVDLAHFNLSDPA